jgi:predicted O-methyltransferase YrrM
VSKQQISLRVPHHPKELEHLKSLAAKATSILEIGSRYGDTLVELAHAMPLKGYVVAVDLPGVQPWGYADSEKSLRENMEKLEAEGYVTRLILGDSTNPRIIKAVKSLGLFDLVFIDGDHRYFGVKSDWEHYGPLGKTVVFHDIIKHPDGARNAPEVWKLWQEIEGDKSEFIGDHSLMGLGIVLR